MKDVVLNGVTIPYNVVKKRNKNTYYHFKKTGHIQINLSRFQSERDAISYMKEHATAFVNKFQSHCMSHRDPHLYYLWGIPYQRHLSATNHWSFDHANHILYEPEELIDHNELHAMERTMFGEELHRLILHHQNNPHVDISKVHYTIRTMTSRHGSCNKKRRRISLNLHLIHHDKTYLEYVFLHEIAHLEHANHSPNYYALLERLCPNYKKLRQALKHDW